MPIPDVSDVATVATTDAVGAFNVVFLEVVPQVEAVGVDVATVRAHGGVTSLKLKFGSEGEGLGRLQGIKSGHSHSTTAYFSKQNDIYIIMINLTTSQEMFKHFLHSQVSRQFFVSPEKS